MQPLIDRWYAARGHAVDRSRACKEYDCELAINGNGHVDRVEEKFIFTDADYDQFLVELVQDMATGDLGWFYHTRCDHLHWIICSGREGREVPRKVYRISWPQFARYLVVDVMTNFRWVKMNVCADGYGVTLNVPVKWEPLLSSGLAVMYEIDRAEIAA